MLPDEGPDDSVLREAELTPDRVAAAKEVTDPATEGELAEDEATGGERVGGPAAVTWTEEQVFMAAAAEGGLGVAVMEVTLG